MADRADIASQTETVALALVPSNDPDIIRRRIEQTRAQMEVTINEIGERLSPDTLIEQAKESVREAAAERIRTMSHEVNQRVEEVSYGLGQTIRENPLPVALIGLGVGWLWMNRRTRGYAPTDATIARYRRYSDYDDGNGHLENTREWIDDVTEAAGRKLDEVKDRAGTAAQNAGEAVSDAAQQAGQSVRRVGESAAETVYRAGETVGEAAENLQDRVSETAERARIEAERLRRQAEWRGRMAVGRTKRTFWDAMEENPLIVGAAVAAVGAALSASIPATEYENQLMGETRDRLLDEAKLRAQDAIERVQSVVEDTQRAAVEEAKDSAIRHQIVVEEADLN